MSEHPDPWGPGGRFIEDGLEPDEDEPTVPKPTCEGMNEPDDD